MQMSEARMVGMLREEVGTLERRLEDERFAAASARQSFAAREQELEVSGCLLWTSVDNQQPWGGGLSRQNLCSGVNQCCRRRLPLGGVEKRAPCVECCIGEVRGLEGGR